jgi:hypothetical protein
MLLQAWAEAVRQDATFVILHCGNQEMIGVHVRESRTLYISDIINVNSKRYGKLQIGLYLAIYHDALDRASRMVDAVSANDLPASWMRLYETPTAEHRDRETGKKGNRLSESDRMDLQKVFLPFIPHNLCS